MAVVSRTIVIPERRRTGDGAGTGAGNRKLLQRYIDRAEFLCTDKKFQTAVVEARNVWNGAHPDYRIDPAYTRDPEDGILNHVGLARASQDWWKFEDKKGWSSHQPTVIDWFKSVAGLHDTAFPHGAYDMSFAEGQVIGSRFIQANMLLGPENMQGKCKKYFPTLKEIYEGFARRIVANGFCLPLDANTTSQDLREFATYALPIVRASTNPGEPFTGWAIDALEAGGVDRKDIARHLGVNPRTVKARLQSPR